MDARKLTPAWDTKQSS